MTNKYNTVLNIGVTSDLRTRVSNHRERKYLRSFTTKYNCDKLVYYEAFDSIEETIKREKQLKKWRRKWKEELIIKVNPQWRDLFDGLSSYI